jgi:hypothetical protein
MPFAVWRDLIGTTIRLPCSVIQISWWPTRFVAITHDPITVALMDRLFGVTMAERRVSRLMSVELAEAEQFV